MRIKDVAKACSISEDTLRYYEKQGLIPPVLKDSGGKRDYSENDLRAIRFAKCMRSSGMSVETLRSYMDMLLEGESTKDRRKALLEAQYIKLTKSLEELTASKAKLAYKIAHYDDIDKEASSIDPLFSF